jgi:hypothetical protein
MTAARALVGTGRRMVVVLTMAGTAHPAMCIGPRTMAGTGRHTMLIGRRITGIVLRTPAIGLLTDSAVRLATSVRDVGIRPANWSAFIAPVAVRWTARARKPYVWSKLVKSFRRTVGPFAAPLEVPQTVYSPFPSRPQRTR